MGYFERAKSLYDRGELVPAAMTLVEGLKRSPQDDQALDELLSLYARELPNPGMERDLLMVLHQREDGWERLRLLEGELEGLDSGDKLQAIERARKGEGLFLEEPAGVAAAALDQRAVPADEGARVSVASAPRAPASPPVSAEGEPLSAREAPRAEAAVAVAPTPASVEENPFAFDREEATLAEKLEEPLVPAGRGLALALVVAFLLLVVFFMVWSAADRPDGPALEEPPVEDQVP